MYLRISYVFLMYTLYVARICLSSFRASADDTVKSTFQISNSF